MLKLNVKSVKKVQNKKDFCLAYSTGLQFNMCSYEEGVITYLFEPNTCRDFLTDVLTVEKTSATRLAVYGLDYKKKEVETFVLGIFEDGNFNQELLLKVITLLERKLGLKSKSRYYVVDNELYIKPGLFWLNKPFRFSLFSLLPLLCTKSATIETLFDISVGNMRYTTLTNAKQAFYQILSKQEEESYEWNYYEYCLADSSYSFTNNVHNNFGTTHYFNRLRAKNLLIDEVDFQAFYKGILPKPVVRKKKLHEN